jgi:acetylornithine deacetylase/succinyl-diaminopimelate desuccinylase-like protein
LPLATALVMAAASRAATTPEARASAAGRAGRDWTASHREAILAELERLVAIPNLASDGANIERNATALVEALGRRGLEARLLRLETGVPPLVVAAWPSPAARETIAFYAHYDGQPVDAREWTTPPWEPVVRDGRLYGRSASDDKAPIVAMLAAIDALRAAHVAPRVNVLFVFEGEEEAGSPHLAQYLARYAAELAPEAWIVCDGPVHQSRRQQLYFGARGVTAVEMTTYGPLHPLHSGHYGNWAPNPIVELTHLIDSLRDTEGRILVPGFYDDVASLTAAEKAALAEMPPVDDALRHELALGRTEGQGPLAERILAPALNLRGIAAGHVGDAATNAIPASAQASIDFRLVPAETPESVRRRVEESLAAQGWLVVHDEPDAATREAHPKVVRLAWDAGGYPPARTPLDGPFARRVVGALTAGLGQAPLRAPSLGGSVPMYLFARGGSVPVIGVPIVNHDNNQHAANENLRLENLWDGVATFATLFAGL